MEGIYGWTHYCYECGEKHHAVKENGVVNFYKPNGTKVSLCVNCCDRLTETSKVDIYVSLPAPIGMIGA